jgi:hypothetical protein
MVGGRRRNPRARQGADVKIGPAAKNSSSRMLGSWSGIIRSHRIRGWQGLRPVCQIGVHRDQQLVVDLRALIRGFRTPTLCRTVAGVLGSAFESLPRRKPRVGREDVWSGAAYGDSGAANGAGGCFSGRRRAVRWARTKATSVFAGEPASGECERCTWRRTVDLARTSPCCSGARPEARS